MPNKMIIKNKKITTFPNAGREFNNVVTRILISFNEFIDLKGLIILMTLIAENLADIKKDIIPVTTTTKSITFHPSLR